MDFGLSFPNYILELLGGNNPYKDIQLEFRKSIFRLYIVLQPPILPFFYVVQYFIQRISLYLLDFLFSLVLI